MSLLPVAEAQRRLLDAAPALGGETAPLDQCIGRWLTGDVLARRDQPWADLSAMDGYAIRHSDLPGPWQVAGESAAGDASLAPLSSGQAMRIFTGAPLPSGADMVVMQEDVTRTGDVIRLAPGVTPRAGAHVRRARSDFAIGDTLIEGGTRLNPAHIALAAIGGYGALPVGRKPRIALISTGSELVEPGEDAPPGRLPASNAVMLGAMLSALPCEVEQVGIISDSLDILTHAFIRAKSADIIVTTGGASVGDHDLVRPALEAAGGAIDFWKIAMRPGKPLISGRLDSALVIGLPGNPVSAFATATLFLLPVIRKCAGSISPLPVPVMTPLGEAMDANASQRDAYLRATLTDGSVAVSGEQDSAMLQSLACANCFIIRHAGTPAADAGTLVPVITF
ncbi:molybdopterin molybdotransferase MoeA [Sphingobium phenoxybenzoativorans]|uniref:molybdopterin molybdotransferase MoeA n=1 Tax=Sphingobium phenoxybenzoativorans TaxID=1592790 RepID=UPI00087246F2|nr:gephyrin-like molybdotransferase Glp [Sphingobium phenoxybenzoativorans]